MSEEEKNTKSTSKKANPEKKEAGTKKPSSKKSSPKKKEAKNKPKSHVKSKKQAKEEKKSEKQDSKKNPSNKKIKKASDKKDEAKLEKSEAESTKKTKKEETKESAEKIETEQTKEKTTSNDSKDSEKTEKIEPNKTADKDEDSSEAAKAERAKKFVEEKKRERAAEAEHASHSKKVKKTVIIASACIVGVYLIGVLVFSFFTYPKTYAADTDISFKTSDNIKSELQKKSSDYVLNIDAFGKKYSINGKDIDYVYDSNLVAQRVQDLKNPFAWPVEVFKEHSFTDSNLTSYNNDKANAAINEIINKHNETAIVPVNAGFNVDVVNKTVTAKEEVVGTQLNGDKFASAATQHLNNASQIFDVSSNEQNLPEFVVSNPKYENALNQANKAMSTIMSFLMGTTPVTSMDSKTFGAWLILGTDYTLVAEPNALAAWTENFDSTYSTLGKPVTFTTPYGKQVSVNNSKSGWKVSSDELATAINQQLAAGSAVNITVPCSSTADVYNPGGKTWGNRYIDADLSTQHARLYDDNGQLIWESDFVSGKPDGQHATPTGVWSILYKESPSILRPEGTGSGTRVQYWMPFTSDGCGLHDATWQSQFGGTWYLQHGSHGCLNLPYNAAQSLYSVANTGDIVVVHD